MSQKVTDAMLAMAIADLPSDKRTQKAIADNVKAMFGMKLSHVTVCRRLKKSPEIMQQAEANLQGEIAKAAASMHLSQGIAKLTEAVDTINAIDGCVISTLTHVQELVQSVVPTEDVKTVDEDGKVTIKLVKLDFVPLKDVRNLCALIDATGRVLEKSALAKKALAEAAGMAPPAQDDRDVYGDDVVDLDAIRKAIKGV